MIPAPRLQDYAGMVLQAWKLIALATVLSIAVAAAAWVFVVPQSFSSTARLFVAVGSTASPRAAYEGNRGALVRVETYAALATSAQVVNRARNTLGSDRTTEAITSQLVATVTPGSNLIGLTATDSDAAGAQNWANAVAGNLVQVVQELESSTGDTVAYLKIIDAADPATSISPPLTSTMVTGGFVGVTCALILTLATAVRRDTVRTRGQANIVSASVPTTERSMS